MGTAFVNRTEQLKLLKKALEYDGQESQVLVFTGIGGMGKTALRLAFEEQLLKPNNIPYAVLDYDGDPGLRPMEATLRALRRQLGRCGVKTPVFDFLYARYFELSTGLKLSEKHFPPELEGVVFILKGIPGVGHVASITYGLSQLGLIAKERLQHKAWLYRIRDLEPREVLNLLPEVLAEDLEEAVSSQSMKITTSAGYRIAVLLDAYDALSASQIDDTLHRRLLLSTPHLLRVIFTRDPLPWEHRYHEEWHGKILHCPPLDGLSYEDAELFLQKRHIDDHDLQKHLFNLTGGYPLHLELCADICREIEETTSRKPVIHDFEGASQAKDLTEELVSRLLRQLTENERDLMELAACPRWCNEEVLEILSSIPESVPRIFKKFVGLSMFSRHPEIPDAYIIRKEVRESLVSRQRKKRLWMQCHGKLAAFHMQCWHESTSFHHLLEALHHSFCEDPDKGAKIFEEYFWKFFEEFRLAQAESFLEAIPLDTLSDIMRRRIDYARLRLMTIGGRTQQNLTDAKSICERLITSEKEESLLEQYLFSYGEVLSYAGEYHKALEMYQKGLAIELKIYGEQHHIVAKSYNCIGNIHYWQGEYTKALEFHQKSLGVRQKMFDEKHSAIAQSYGNIGLDYWKKGEYEKALEYLLQNLTIVLKVHGEEHPRVASAYNNLGIIYYEHCEYEKALEYHEKGLAANRKVFGEEHPAVANSYNNMGIIYREQGKFEKSFEYHKKSLAIRLLVCGAEHPDTAYSYFNFGNLYWSLGEYKEALAHFEKSIAIRCKIHGEKHPDVAASYNNIGTVYVDLGCYGKALEYFEKSLAIRREVCGEEHPAVAESYINIANVHKWQGDYGTALELCHKCLAIRLKNFGEGHPRVANVYNTIGSVYAKKEEYEGALEYLEKALAIRLKNFGEKHPDVAESLMDIAYILRGLRRDDEAREKMRKSADMYCTFKLWKNAVNGLISLAQELEQKGSSEEAEAVRKEAQEIRREHHVP